MKIEGERLGKIETEQGRKEERQRGLSFWCYAQRFHIYRTQLNHVRNRERKRYSQKEIETEKNRDRDGSEIYFGAVLNVQTENDRETQRDRQKRQRLFYVSNLTDL